MDDLRTMWRAANPGPAPAANDYSTGIFQTIGIILILRRIDGGSHNDQATKSFRHSFESFMEQRDRSIDKTHCLLKRSSR